MTNSRVDVPANHHLHAVEPDPDGPDAEANGKVNPDADPPAEANQTPDGQTNRAEDDQAADGQIEAGPDPAADSQIDAGPDPAADGQIDAGPDQAGDSQIEGIDQAETDQTALGHSAPAATDRSSPKVAAVPLQRDPDEAALRLTEAAVFASATPMTPRALSQILPDDLDPAAVIAALQARYAGRGIELCEVGGGLQFRTAADLAPQLRKVVQVPRRLPRVALETLAIVAYHQPITRPEIEDLRGTGLSQQTLDVLLENDLIVARGRKETPGRPTLWGTTAKFLEYFGLRDIRELPRRQDLLLEAVRPETDPMAAEDAQSGQAGTPLA